MKRGKNVLPEQATCFNTGITNLLNKTIYYLRDFISDSISRMAGKRMVLIQSQKILGF